MSTTTLCTTVDCLVSARADRDNAMPVPARLVYNPADPYVVLLQVARKVTWELARELLTNVLDPLPYGVGLGDVSVAGVDDELWVELTSPTGHAVLWLAVEQVLEFLDATYWMVPAGTESSRIDWDRELRLIGGRP
jgi:hypothetical protein